MNNPHLYRRDGHSDAVTCSDQNTEGCYFTSPGGQFVLQMIGLKKIILNSYQLPLYSLIN